MQRFVFGMVVVWWALLGMAPAVAQQPSSLPGATVSTGQQYFMRYCSACHGVHGRGDGPTASVLQPPPADLTRIAQRRDGLFPVAEMTAYIDGRTVIPAHGSREMPVWGAYFGEGHPLSWVPSADAVAGRWPEVAQPARPSSAAFSRRSTSTSKPSSNNDPTVHGERNGLQEYTRSSRQRDVKCPHREKSVDTRARGSMSAPRKERAQDLLAASAKLVQESAEIRAESAETREESAALLQASRRLLGKSRQLVEKSSEVDQKP